MSGAGIFFDGETSARRTVAVEAGADALGIRGADGDPIAEWAYDDLRALPAPRDVLRLGRSSSPSLARLEIREPILITEIERRAKDSIAAA